MKKEKLTPEEKKAIKQANVILDRLIASAKKKGAFIGESTIKKAAILLTTIVLLTSCVTTRVIRGPISAINGNIVVVEGYTFQCDTTGLFVGKVVTFTPTFNRSKVNSKIVKN